MADETYKALMELKGQIGRIEGKIDLLVPEVNAMKCTLEVHTEKIGNLRGISTTWGVIGAACFTFFLKLINPTRF